MVDGKIVTIHAASTANDLDQGAAQAVLKAILVCDLVDSTRLIEQLGDEAAAAVLHRHDRLARDLLRAHHGLEIDKTDGFLFLFDRPIEAVDFAVEYHHALAHLGQDSDLAIVARAGIHLGEVVIHENAADDIARGAKPLEVEGLAKATAARLMSLALPGQTLLTQAAFELARRSMIGGTRDHVMSWRDHGWYAMQGLDAPVAVFEAGDAATAPLAPPTDTTKAWAVPAPLARDIRSRWRPRVMAGGLLLVAGIVVAAWLLGAASPERPGVDTHLLLVMASATPIGGPTLSPDATMIAYVEHDDLYVRRIGGGRSVQLTQTAGREQVPAFSPDGERIAYNFLAPGSGISEIRTIPTFGGEPVLLTLSGSMPSWSADGRQIVYVDRASEGGAAIVTVMANGQQPHIVHTTDAVYHPYDPAFSPDGKSIAFVRSLGGATGEIWLIDTDGTHLRPLTDDPPGAFSNDPVFTPDGKWVVHSSSRGGATNLWKISVGGSAGNAQLQQLTTGPGPDAMVSVANQGAVAFLNSRMKKVVRLVGLQGDEQELHASPNYVWAPAFSPDEASIAWSQAEPGGSWGIWIMRADGSLPRQLTDTQAPHIYPRFTPDGRYVIYHEWLAGANRVWRVPAGGGPAQPLTPEGVDAAYADVSPDGKLLAYVRTDDVPRIVVVPMDAALADPASANAGGSILVPQAATLPRWSPDGKHLAFAVDRSINSGIYLVDAAGGEVRQISARGSFPAWWPDSRSVGYIVTGDDQVQEVHQVSLETGARAKVERLRYHFGNAPFDVGASGRIVTSDDVPQSYEVWMLE